MKFSEVFRLLLLICRLILTHHTLSYPFRTLIPKSHKHQPSTYHPEEAGHTAAAQGNPQEQVVHPEEDAAAAVDHTGPDPGTGLEGEHRTGPGPGPGPGADGRTGRPEGVDRTGLEEAGRIDPGVEERRIGLEGEERHIGLEGAVGRIVGVGRRIGLGEDRSFRGEGWFFRLWSRSFGRWRRGGV